MSDKVITWLDHWNSDGQGIIILNHITSRPSSMGTRASDKTCSEDLEPVQTGGVRRRTVTGTRCHVNQHRPALMRPLAPLGVDGTAGFYGGGNHSWSSGTVAGNLRGVKVPDWVKLPPFMLDSSATWRVGFQTVGAVGAGAVGLGLIDV